MVPSRPPDSSGPFDSEGLVDAVDDFDDSLLDVPSVFPARMVNEYVYCPRFFHLAFSAREQGENDYTVEGKWLHRPVDRASGSLSTDSRPATARSLTLTSPRLGLTAKIDMVESSDGEAVPIEYKRGGPKDGDQPVWEPERVQLAVAGLLLRAEGHTSNHGEVYFAGARDRVVVEFDEALIERVKTAVVEMRVVAADPVPPPPLIDSPKCPACVMVGVCLPDEQNLLRERAHEMPRRMMASDPVARPLYVTVPGAFVAKDGERIVIKKGGAEIESVRLIDVSQLNLYGNVTVSPAALRELFSQDAPVCWFSTGGWFYGLADGLPSKNVELRRRQARLGEEESLTIAKRMIEGKILNARTLLRRNGPSNSPALGELKRMARLSATATDPARLLGLEGGAARIYFSRFDSMLGSVAVAYGFDFHTRNRRPPTDAVNCLLSYAYGLLSKDCTTTLLAVGLDPYMGVFHMPRFGRPALALDLAEEFRTIIGDSVVITLLNTGEIRPSDFVTVGHACSLTAGGRKTVLGAYERRMATELIHPIFGYRVSYRRALEVQARLLGAVILGEVPEYRALTTR